MSTPESSPINKSESEARPEVSAEAGKRLEKIADKQERAVELSPRDAEALAERARLEALENAISVEAGGAEKQKPRAAAGPRKRVTKKQRSDSFKHQMKEVQKELPPTSRTFSKFVHNPVVEKTSELVGATVARPNALLAGSFCAFVLTLLVYVVAKTIGYQLSGFETIGAFVIGWLIGLIYDYLRVIVTGKKQ